MAVGKVSAFLLLALVVQGVYAGGAGVTVPYLERWGIYEFDPVTLQVTQVFTSPKEISKLRISSAGDIFAFSMEVDGDALEICTFDATEGAFTRLTENGHMDV